MGWSTTRRAWTRAHDAWLRRQRFQSRPLAIVFDECYAADARREDAGGTRSTRRSPSSPLSRRTPRSSARLVCLRGVSTLTAFALTVELGDWTRFRPRVARPVPRPHPERGLKRRAAPPRRDHQDRQHARPPAAGRGRLAPTPPLRAERHARTQTHGKYTRRRASPSRPRAPAGCTRRWHALEARGKPRTIVAVAVARELAGHCWALATME